MNNRINLKVTYSCTSHFQLIFILIRKSSKMNNVKKKNWIKNLQFFSYSSLLISNEVYNFKLKRLFAQFLMHCFYDDTVAQDTREKFLMSVKLHCNMSDFKRNHFPPNIQVHVLVIIRWIFKFFFR